MLILTVYMAYVIFDTSLHLTAFKEFVISH